MFDKIVVPLDGSAFAESALPLACLLATRAEAGLRFVTVHEPVPAFAQAEWETSAREWSERYLEEVGRRSADSACTAETRVLTGPVATELEEYVADVGADLVVMATHGRGTLTRAWLGSVADHFVRHSPCPVILIRPSAEEDAPELTAAPSVSRILVPLDGSDFSEAVLDRAAGLARLFGASLELVRIVTYPAEIASPYLPHTVQLNQKVVDEANRAALEYLEGIARGLSGEGLDAGVRVRIDGQSGRGILHAAEEAEVDMIAMATHARGGVRRAFLGSTADKVVRGAKRPIFLFRPTH